MGVLTPEQAAQLRRDIADARKRRDANRAEINKGYDALMGTPISPQDLPVNNVSHPHGNRGRADATLSVPMSGLNDNTPGQSMNTDDY